MSRKSVFNVKIQTALEHSLASNFVRLCAAEGIDAENASRALELRLDALSQLKLTEQERGLS
jgi:hypothetical protein